MHPNSPQLLDDEGERHPLCCFRMLAILNDSDCAYRLMSMYNNLHASIHAKNTHVKVHHCVSRSATSFGWVTPVFELYCIAEPNTNRNALAQSASKIAQWVQREEERLFIIGGAVCTLSLSMAIAVRVPTLILSNRFSDIFLYLRTQTMKKVLCIYYLVIYYTQYCVRANSRSSFYFVVPYLVLPLHLKISCKMYW